MTELIALSAEQLRLATLRGDLSAFEVVEAILDHTYANNASINAIVALRGEAALDEAAALDRVRADDRGPLHGVPFTVKDTTLTRDMPATFGSKAIRRSLPGVDSLWVTRLRRAGAVLIGRTNMPELGMRVSTENELYGTTCNPRSPDRTPGGSSGGAAAAVASRFAPLAHGSDGGGSIRLPAAFCGVVGIRPSRGLIPLSPQSFDHCEGLTAQGALANTTRDVALMIDVMAGPAVGDLFTPPMPKEGYLSATKRELPVATRIAYTTTTANGGVEEAVLVDLRRVLVGLESAGYAIAEVEVDFSGLVAHHQLIIEAQIAHLAHSLAPIEAFEDSTKELIDRGDQITVQQYLDAVAALRRKAAELLELWRRIDLLLTPTTTVPAPLLNDLPTRLPYDERWATYRQWSSFNYPFNDTGQPALSIPVPNDTSLPGAVQVIGRLGEDALVLTAGTLIESLFGNAEPPAL